jgi:hypothetical protein
MNVLDKFKWIVAATVFCAPVLCLGGRPVFEDLSLAELTKASKLIAVVTRATAETSAKGAYGCESLEWRLSVVAILKSSQRADVAPSQTIIVRKNVNSYRDCVLREGSTTKGASFSARRYQPSDMDAPEQERFIVFLDSGDPGFELTADLAYESSARRLEIEKLLHVPRGNAIEQTAPTEPRDRLGGP